MPMDPDYTWLGIGKKVGGSGLVYKREFTWGSIGRLTMMDDPHEFQIKNSGWGLGLGGSTGLVVVCVFNTFGMPDVMWLDDWSIDLSLGGKWSAAVKALNKYRFFARIAKIGPKFGKAASEVNDLREAVNELYDLYDIVDGKRTLMTFDVPGVGWGVEVAVHKMSGTFRITR